MTQVSVDLRQQWHPSETSPEREARSASAAVALALAAAQDQLASDGWGHGEPEWSFTFGEFNVVVWAETVPGDTGDRRIRLRAATGLIEIGTRPAPAEISVLRPRPDLD